MPGRIQQRIEQVSVGDISQVVAGDGLSGGGSSGAVSLAVDVTALSVVTAVAADYIAIEDVGDGSTKKALISDVITAGDVTGVTAGNLVDVTDPTGPVPTINVDLSEASPSTSDADGDYFLVTDAASAQYKLTKANIALSGMNNDSGWTANTGDITAVVAGTNTSGGATSGSATINLAIDAEVDFADQLATKPEMKDYAETVNAIGSTGGGTQDIDLTAGNVVSATVDTSTNTFTFSNPSATGKSCSFTLYLTNGGSQTVAWPGTVDWAGGTAPTLTASGVDVLAFTTLDAGTIWYGFSAGLDMQ